MANEHGALAVWEKWRENVAIITVAGECDSHTMWSLNRILSNVIRATDKIILNLEGVTFMDSSAFNLLVRTRNRARMRGGNMVLVSPHKGSKVLDIMALQTHVLVARNEEEAVKYLKSA